MPSSVGNQASSAIHIAPATTTGMGTADRLVGILRRDLKLGPTAPIDGNTPLLGGDYDLDSLDILMLITSVEKEFNIKIPNEAVRRDAFKTVASLAAYIDLRRE